MTTFIQVNLNKNRAAQDLLIHHAGELGAAVCVVSEPARTPSSQQWFFSNNGLAAIYINTRVALYPASLVAKGQNSVSVRYGDIHIVSCYVSPNLDYGGFSDFLDELTNLHTTFISNKALICGDFNAHSRLWGSPTTDRRGDLVEEWAAQMDLRVLNSGNKPTFVGRQGQSIIDLTWASSDSFRLVHDWTVREDIVSLSDHMYISFNYTNNVNSNVNRPFPYSSPRWNFRKMDVEMYKASIDWSCAVAPVDENYMINFPPDRWINRCVTNACKAAVPRFRARGRGRPTYWWNSDIEALRSTVHRTRRIWTRGRNRDTPEELTRKRAEYLLATQMLKGAIHRAKTSAWQELIATLDNDPWGLPYRIVLNRLRLSTPGLTITLESDVLRALLDKLFPPGNPLIPIDLGDCEEGRTPVTVEEVKRAIAAKVNTSTSPGPDGFKATTLKKFPHDMVCRLAQIFNIYLKHGVFPPSWKLADLVLIPKGESLPGELPKARPICLLNEVGKTFERVIADRIIGFMEDNERSNLSDNQFGFRKMRSTTDALHLVKSIITRARADGKVALAFSLDIENAFNSIKLSAIRNAMRVRGFPKYLRRIIEAYLTDRRIRYITASGAKRTRRVNRGVPQGSVLGPILWNIAYDKVLRTLLFDDCHVICYADDTLLVVVRDDFDEACAAILDCLERILINIRSLGLKVSWQKSEAIFFGHCPRGAYIDVEGVRIHLTNSMKYLGVYIDRRLNFCNHFSHVAAKVTRISRALCGILPNLRGPLECKRRLYCTVITSIILYAAPIWSEELSFSGNQQRVLQRAIRITALRAVMAYRSVSYVAASLLARIPPIHLYAECLSRTYFRLKELKESGNYYADAPREIRQEEQVVLMQQWEEYLGDERLPGKRTRDAISPHFDLWMNRRSGFLTFRITQLLTGHGCFSSFLYRINKEESPVCRYCNLATDTAEHTLADCAFWDLERGELTAVIGQDLSLSTVVAAICRSREAWKALSTFAERVMRTKEEDERRRKQGLDVNRIIVGIVPENL